MKSRTLSNGANWGYTIDNIPHSPAIASVYDARIGDGYTPPTRPPRHRKPELAEGSNASVLERLRAEKIGLKKAIKLLLLLQNVKVLTDEQMDRMKTLVGFPVSQDALLSYIAEGERGPIASLSSAQKSLLRQIIERRAHFEEALAALESPDFDGL